MLSVAMLTVMDAAAALGLASESSEMAATRFPYWIFGLGVLAMASAILSAPPLDSFYSASAKKKGRKNRRKIVRPTCHLVIIKIERVQYGLGEDLIEPIGSGVERLHYPRGGSASMEHNDDDNKNR